MDSVIRRQRLGVLKEESTLPASSEPGGKVDPHAGATHSHTYTATISTIKTSIRPSALRQSHAALRSNKTTFPRTANPKATCK
ncbi:hypothetical protein SRHO_G00088260 [Serrasalmus rhombeus]